jgi:multicomponent Na+:H+ antiporter subunit E
MNVEGRRGNNERGTGPSPTAGRGLRDRARRWSPGAILLRVIAMAILWLVLAEGEVRYWGLVLGAVIAAALVSLLLMPSSGLGFSPIGFLRFAPFFLGQSVLGGVDVALRALSLRPRIDPVYVECRLRLNEEPARVLVANTMSLMPGTLSVSLEGRRLKMHVLDRAMPAVERARDVEEHTARTFRLVLADE